MNQRFSQWLLIAVMGLSIPALSPAAASAEQLGGGYDRWYGWAGPLYGGFGGYPGARYVSGAAYWGGPNWNWGGHREYAWGGPDFVGWGWGNWGGCGAGGWGWDGYGPGGVWDGDNWSGTGVGVDVVPSPANSKSTTPGNSVIMNLSVPADAQVFVNGVATISTGAVRRYRADDLKPGNYPYEVRAEVVRDGQKLVDSQRVDLRTGKSTSVVFDFSPEAIAARRVPTSLTLHVPADAKVYLGDNPTSSTGAVRHFATQLKAGESYSDYKVRVEVNNGGKLETWQEVISLAAGETRELKFDFPTGGTPHVAANSSR